MITAAVVSPRATADEHLLDDPVWQHRRRVGRLPRDVVGDWRYGSLHYYRFLAGLGIRAGIAHRAGKKRNAGGVWNIQDFRYNAQSDTHTCPAGETLTHRLVRPSSRTILYKARPGVCERCRFRSQCSLSGKERGLSRSFDRGFLEEAQRWLTTQEERRRLRQQKVYVETVFALAKDRHGLRRAQWRGKWKVQIQVWLTAAALNIKKLARTTATAGGVGAGALQVFPCRLIAWSRSVFRRTLLPALCASR